MLPPNHTAPAQLIDMWTNTLVEQFQSYINHESVSYLRDSAQQHLTSHVSQIHADFIQPYIIEPLSNLLAYSMSATGTDLTSVFLLVLTIFMSLIILDYARRMVMFWVRLVYQIMFWGVIVGTGWYVYRFGTGKTLQDAAWLLSLAEGFVGDFVHKAISGDNGAGFGAGSGRMSDRGGYGSGK